MRYTEESIDTRTINATIGSRLKAARLFHKKSQTQIGELLGIAYQQIQKYEKGESPITAINLFVISCYYRIPVEWFFGDIKLTKKLDKTAVNDAINLEDIFKHYSKIGDEGVRRLVIALAKELSSTT